MIKKQVSISYVTGPTAAIADRLFAVSGYPLLSIYMPTHRAGADVWQNPIRLKNLLAGAGQDLELGGMTAAEAQEFLRPLNELQEDREFWQKQANGLALFRSQSGLEVIQSSVSVPEMCLVGDRFHLKPLLMALTDDKKFYVLALSQHAVRLFRGSAWGLEEVQGLEFPASLAAKENGADRSLQTYAYGEGTRVQHASDSERKEAITNYCRQVDQVIGSVTGENDFVILAAVDYIAEIYRDASSLRRMGGTILRGNFDHAGPSEIFEKVMPIADKHFNERVAAAETRFLDSLGTGKGLDTPKEAIQAAHQGRVEMLLVPVGVHIWGDRTGSDELRIMEKQSPRNHDLLNDAVFDTWKSGGRVMAVPADKMPHGLQVAAITRF